MTLSKRRMVALKGLLEVALSDTRDAILGVSPILKVEEDKQYKAVRRWLRYVDRTLREEDSRE